MSRDEFDVREEYIGAGNLDTYSFDFKIEELSQLLVVEYDDTGVETQRVRGDDTTYLSSVTFNDDGGGTVVLAANLTTDYKLVLLLANDEPTQPYTFRNRADFTLSRISAAFDWIAGAVQRVAYLGQRSIRLNDHDDIASVDMSLPANIADNPNASLVVNTTGDGFNFGPTSDQIEGAQAAANAAAVSAAASAAEAVAAAADATAAAASATDASAQVIAAEAARDAALAAQVAAELAETNAETAEVNAELAETNAETALASTLIAQTAAELAETNAETALAATIVARDAALAAQTAAELAETNAETAETAAEAAQAAAEVFAANAHGLIEYANDAAYELVHGVGAAGDVYYNTTTNKVRVYSTLWSNLGSGGGGGGGSIEWTPDANAPLAAVENGQKVWIFDAGLEQKIYALVKVPSAYIAGTQILLKLCMYSPSTSGDIQMQTVTTLIRQGVDAVTSTTNQRTSTNAAFTTAAGTVDEPNEIEFDLSATVGTINSVAISAGDLLFVMLTRAISGDTSSDVAKILSYSAEVQAS